MYTFCNWRCFMCVCKQDAIMRRMNFDIAELLSKKMLGTLSPVEEERLDEWLKASERNREMWENFMSGKSWRERRQLGDGEDVREMVLELLND